jgi:hypothetical protein
MGALLPTAEKNYEFKSRIYKFSQISYDGTEVTFKVDQSAESAVVILPASGAPTASLGSSDSSFEKTVTLSSGSASATVVVVIAHGQTVAGAKA